MKNNAPTSRIGFWLGATWVILLLLAPGTVRGGETSAFQKVLKEHSDAVVTIKLLLTLKGGFAGPDGQQMESEAAGIVIDPAGVILASSTEIGGLPPALRSLLSRVGEMSMIPSDIKILVGDDPDGLEATIIARDSDLDLVWLRIKNPGDKSFPAMNLTDSASPRAGQKLLGLMHMDKYFDRTIVIEEFRVAGITTNPRRLYVPGSQLGEGFCTPVFTLEGKFVGITVLQLPDIEVAPDNPFAAMSQMADIELLSGGFILPADAISKATARALASEAQAESEEAE